MPVRPLLAAVAWAALCAASPAHASGYAVNEQSVRGLGRAFAGQTAFADDASTLWYNPASSSAFDRRVATLGASGVFSRGEVRDKGTTLSGPFAAAPVGGRRGDDPLEPGGVPNAALAAPLGGGWFAGLSVNAPFGLTTSYEPGWFGRYDSTRTELRTGTVTASPAKRVGAFAFSAGLSAQYADAVLESGLPNIPGAPDGVLQVKGDDWSLGHVVGSRWTPTPDLAFGASYRSAVKHTLEGSERIAGLAGPLAGGNRSVAGAARLKTPDVARLGAAWRTSPRLTHVAIERTAVERSDILFEGSPAARRLDVRGDVKGDALVVGLGGSVRF